MFINASLDLEQSKQYAICNICDATAQKYDRLTRGKLNRAKYRYILNGNLVHSPENLRLGIRFTFQKDSDPEAQHRSGLGTTLWMSQSEPLFEPNLFSENWKQLFIDLEHLNTFWMSFHHRTASLVVGSLQTIKWMATANHKKPIVLCKIFIIMSF